MRIACDESAVPGKGACVNNRVGHGQMILHAYLRCAHGKHITKRHDCALHSVCCERVRGALTGLHQQLPINFVNDNRGYEHVIVVCDIGSKPVRVNVVRQIFQPTRGVYDYDDSCPLVQ